ncbi:MAG: hypothetical protein ISS78_04395 [Phycisphaerae bacterium]|nr:hypothetical protein [Phycisphaerae bacterium]
MAKRVTLIVIGSVIVIGLLSCTVAYTVDYTEHAVVTNNISGTSKPIKGPTDAGLKFKWPWPIEQVTTYKATLYTLEDAIAEVETSDHQKIIVTTYCLWRMDDPNKFNKTKETIEAGQEALRNLLAARKSAVVGNHVLADFVNSNPRDMLIPQIEREILGPLKAQARSDWGIEVVSVGVKTFGLPEGVTKQVIETMKEERQQEAERLRSQGDATAQAIEERAKEASAKIIAFAERKANSIESEGALAAARLYPEFSRNEAFSMFLRSLKSLEEELSGQAVIVLDPSVLPAVRYFSEGPSLPSGAPGAGKPEKRK